MTPPILLSRAAIDDQRWNLLIDQSGHSVVYGYSWYLDEICDTWKALVWPSAEDYQIVMPLPVRRKWSIEVIQQPLFCQYLGLFSALEISESQLYSFLEKVSSSFAYISSYHFHPDLSVILNRVLPQFTKFEIKRNHTYWLSLEDSLSTIRSNYSSDRKMNLKRSEKEKWIVEQSNNIIPLITLFQKHHACKIPGGVADISYSILTGLFKSLNLHKAAELLYILKEGEIHAGALFVKTGKKVLYLFNAADETGRVGNARTFLLDHYFQSNTGKALIFDFESPEKVSVSLFYKSFGALKMPYYSIRKNDLPFPFKQIQNWRISKALNTTEVPFEGS
jgi:hypothetical protein